MLLSLWLFWRSHADLGKNWSVSLEVRQGHQLIKHGVYRSIRHPMYASIWLWCLAQGLLLENWLAGWYALVAFALFLQGTSALADPVQVASRSRGIPRSTPRAAAVPAKHVPGSKPHKAPAIRRTPPRADSTELELPQLG